MRFQSATTIFATKERQEILSFLRVLTTQLIWTCILFLKIHKTELKHIKF